MNASHLVVLGLLAQAPALSSSPATVEGTVVQSGNGRPIAGARVQLFHPQSGQPENPGGGRGGPPLDLEDLKPYSAVTEQDGRFVFNSVKPGMYRLVALHSGGYVPGELGQRSATGIGVSFQLSPGQQLRGAELVLTPTASIAGRVYDRDGPVGRLQVQALRPVYRNGQRSLTIVQSVLTNDRGEYRLFWLPPGRYYVTARPFNDAGAGRPDGPESALTSAVHITEPTRVGSFEQASSPIVTSRKLADGDVVEEVQVPIFFPGTPDVNGASAIALEPGTLAEGMDIAITTGPVRARHIRGVVLENGQPVAGAGVTATPRTLDPSLVIPSGRTSADGSFDIAGAVEGSYFLFARTNPGATGGLALQVTDADIDNLVIPVAPGSRLAGRFVIEGRSRIGRDPDMASLRVTLRREPDLLGLPEAGPTFSPPPAPDGSFELQGVPAGDFRLSVRALPPGAYVKSIRLGGDDVLDGGLHLTGPSRDTLEIVVAADGGGLAGTVVNARRDPIANAMVVLVPGPVDRHRSDLYRSTTTDASGRFRLQGIAAGSYSLFAWEAIEDGAWQNPDFVREYDSRGKPVLVRDSVDESIQLTAITER